MTLAVLKIFVKPSTFECHVANWTSITINQKRSPKSTKIMKKFELGECVCLTIVDKMFSITYFYLLSLTKKFKSEYKLCRWSNESDLISKNFKK